MKQIIVSQKSIISENHLEMNLGADDDILAEEDVLEFEEDFD